MTDDEVTPKRAVIALMNGTAPELTNEIATLWEQYPVDVVMVADAGRITLNADKERITFDAKTMDVFWLIGFAGWKAIECYSPHVVLSASTGRSVADLIRADEGLDDVERAYKERRAAAQTLIDAANPVSAPWPPDIPRPAADREAFDDPQYKTAFDLVCLAAAFAFFHEFRHVMLARDNVRPRDLREEELACDVWARNFLIARLAKYASDNGHDYHQVLRKRAMGLALAGLILHEITPVWDHGGNRAYFSVQDRLAAILDNTPLPPNDHFWVFVASLLVGILRQRHVQIDAPPMSARDLSLYLLTKI